VAPGFSVTVVRETDLVLVPTYCTGSPRPIECGLLTGTGATPFRVPGAVHIGIDATGTLYHTAAVPASPLNYVQFGPSDVGQLIQRTTPAGITEDLVQIHTGFCADDPLICNQQTGVTTLSDFRLDLANGRILVPMRMQVVPFGTTTLQNDVVGIVAIWGLPTVFDTLITFDPGNAGLHALTAALPDGFRSADAIQVWTGDVRSMPDWSQAQPLACQAAVSPVPGQQVAVADTLPDPEVGTARYYITATQLAADRRLGRQYHDGAFSARNPASLPACVIP
jgi:hypothetical protein